MNRISIRSQGCEETKHKSKKERYQMQNEKNARRRDMGGTWFWI